MDAQTLSDLIDRQRPGYCLERPFYCEPAIFEFDLQHVVMPYWQFVGHSARIPNAGDFFLLDFAGESLIIARGASGGVHALLNVCRHRGSRVCLETSGTRQRFSCGYHAWSYDTDGSLRAAAAMPADFCKEEHGLRSFPVKLLEGLIFLNLSDEPLCFNDAWQDGTQYLQPHGLDQAKVAARRVWRVHANWKLVMENFRECYHCPAAHPEYCSVMAHGLDDDLNGQDVTREFADFANRWYREDAARGRPASQTERRGSHHHLCGRYPIQEGFHTQSRDGKPLAPLMGKLSEYDDGVTTLSTYPLHYTTASADHAVLFRFTPITVQETDVELTWLVDNGADPEKDYNVDNLTWMWAITTEQDKFIVDENQAGVNSRFFTPGPYSDREPDVKQFIAWYLKRLRMATTPIPE